MVLAAAERKRTALLRRHAVEAAEQRALHAAEAVRVDVGGDATSQGSATGSVASGARWEEALKDAVRSEEVSRLRD